MAEAIIFIGVIGAAVQFTDTGSRLVSRLISLASKVQDSQRCLQLTLHQIRMLLELAEREKKRRVSETNNNLLPALTASQQEDPNSSLPPSQSSSNSGLEALWHSCTAEALELDKLIEQMLQTAGENPLRRGWRKLCTLKNEKKIEESVTRIERYKTLLSPWYGQECLDHMQQVHLNMADLQGQMLNIQQGVAHLNEVTQRLMLASTAPMHQSLPGMLQENQETQPIPQSQRLLEFAQDGDQQEPWAFQKSESALCQTSKALTKKKNGRLPPQVADGLITATDSQSLSPSGGRLTPTQRLDQAGCTSIAQNTSKPSTFKPLADSLIVTCKCKSSGWQKIVRFSHDTVLMGRHFSYVSSECPLHRKHDPRFKTLIRFRKRLPYMVSVMEGILEIGWSSGCPAIGVSLRAETRVRRHYLDYFLFKLNNTYSSSSTHRSRPELVDLQDRLLKTAQRKLIEVFNSGQASPDDVDATGQTLVHQQMENLGQVDEGFSIRMIKVMLAMGSKANIVDDYGCTVPQFYIKCKPTSRTNEHGRQDFTLSSIGHDLLEWTECGTIEFESAIQILDCVRRWPESITDLGYPVICDIVLRKSVRDLEKYIDSALSIDEQSRSKFTPLHFVTAADWLEGVKFLLGHGADKFAEDREGNRALDVAIDIQSASLVGLLLVGDILPYMDDNKASRYATLGRCLDTILLSNQAIQAAMVQALARQRQFLHGFRPFHILSQRHVHSFYPNTSLFAEEFHAAGFSDVEEYNEQGMTPLMCACDSGNPKMISFLLKHGANPSKYHRDAALCSGHFADFADLWLWHIGYNDSLEHDEIVTLLEPGFKGRASVNSTCRCSPDGFSPLTAMCRHGNMSSWKRKQIFENMVAHLRPEHIDIDIQWRSFVILEIFERLQITHTCIRPGSKMPIFPEDDRLEIEEEESEIYANFNDVLGEYDSFQQAYPGPIGKGVGEFFEKLDYDIRRGYDLRPTQDEYWYTLLTALPPTWSWRDLDIFQPSENYQRKAWLTTNGKWVLFEHEEGEGESSMLRLLFD